MANIPTDVLPMPLNDPISLLFIVTPFGLMTTLVLCLSYVGLGKRNIMLHWWIVGDLLLAAYRTSAMLQPGVLGEHFSSITVLSPQQALLAGTSLLVAAVGAHTLALLHLGDGSPSRRRQYLLMAGPALLYLAVATLLLHTAWVIPWFTATMALVIGLQFATTLRLRSRYRGAWGLLIGQLLLMLFHGRTTLLLVLHPVAPLPFDEPDVPSMMALYLDFMVSFLFTLAFALMLQEQLRLQLTHLSVTDPLTGALNRRGALSMLNQTWARDNHLQPPTAVAMIDLDRFKVINDRYGHAAGDIALQTFAATVMRLKRQADVFVRWGGEEFLLVLPATDVHQARQFMERLRAELKTPEGAAALPFTLEFSAGLADSQALSASEDFEALLRAVDKALYRAKQRRDHVELVQASDL